jgi:hypothetical protein
VPAADGPVEGLAEAADDRVEVHRAGAGAAVGVIGAVEEAQGPATEDFAAVRAAVREAAEGDLAADLRTAVRPEVAIVRPFNPFRDPANPAQAIRAAVDPVLANRRQAPEIQIRVDQILLDQGLRELIVPVSANRVIGQATAIGLVTDRGIAPATATAQAPSRAMVTGPATSRAMVIARGIDLATGREFTHRLTATDRGTGRAIAPITVTDRGPASPAIPIIHAAARRTGTDIGSRSITVGITALGTGTGITAARIGTPTRGALGA